MPVGTFVATPTGKKKIDFKILLTTLGEPESAIKEMAAKIFEQASLISSKNVGIEDESKPTEVSMDLPRGYYGLAFSLTNASGDNVIFAIVTKLVSMALFSYAVDAWKGKIVAVIDNLRKGGRIQTVLVEDLQLSLEREFDAFEL